MAARKKAGELAIIAAIRAAAARGVKSGSVRLGIGDDCAILRVPRGHELLVTTDLSLEGRHFRRNWHSGNSVGHRTLARGLSDLAAMGAEPLAAFLSLAMPRKLVHTRWSAEFMEGLLALAKVAGVSLAGGDTAESQADVIADIVLTGSAPAGKALLRSGARAGDILYVTGALGGAAAELAMLSAGKKNLTGEHPHLFPQPRLTVGKKLRGIATACIDLSDGLSTDLAHLCAESRCGAVVEENSLPIHTLAEWRKDALHLALHGGEDYELLFTARPSAKVPRTIAGVKITRIGAMTTGRSMKIVDTAGKKTALEVKGWEHFQ